MINQGQTLRLNQRLSPVQIQTIKLVGLSVQELEQAVRKELEENPALDDNPSTTLEEDAPGDVSLDSVSQEDPLSSYSFRSNQSSGERPPFDYNLSVRETFSQSLIDQLGFKQLSPEDEEVARFIIGSLDSDGYLRRDLPSLVDDLAFRLALDVPEEKVEEILHIIQEFDPPGVGARNLRECLLLQLRSKTPSPLNDLAYEILSDHYDDFVEKRFKKIGAALDVDDEDLKDIVKVISKLNPSPGGGIDDSYDDIASRIVPDFILYEEGGELRYEMPRSGIPPLRVSKQYEKIIQESPKSQEEKIASDFAKSRLSAAKYFIEAVKQRQVTLHKCMDAIIALQKEYLLSGDEADLRPMILEDVAKVAQLDISTISRVVGNKYIDTSFGIIPMRYLFSERMSTSDGSEVSARAIRKDLKEIVDSEDKHAPLTDEQIVQVLSSRGYKIARRTVAKYRDQLGIPLARWRKEV